MTKEQLLQDIYGAGLICMDLRLFLDTNPDHKEAMADFRKHCEEYARLKVAFERDFGPLTGFNDQGFSEFSWTRGPWPWKQV